MKIIGEDPQVTKKPGTGPLRRRPPSIGESKAEEIVLAALQKALDNRHFVIRNLELDGLEIPIPLVLVGPPGVWVLYPTLQRGFFRAKGDEWERLSDRHHDYTPVHPNMVTRTVLMGKAVETFLAGHGYEKVKVEPVLIFTDPGVHVESVRSAVRIVLMDALFRFVGGLLKSAPVLNWRDSQILINLLTKGSVEEPESEPSEPEQDEFSFVEKKERRKLTLPDISIPLPPDDKVVKAMGKVPFTSKQLVFLGCLIVINILILAGFVVLILVLSSGHP